MVRTQRIVNAAAIQAGSLLFDTAKTQEKAQDLLSDACQSFEEPAGSRLCVFPEAFLGGYPKGHHFGAPVGSRSAAGREMFRRYAEGAIQVPGPETQQLAKAARDHKTDIVIGVIERAGQTLYCTALFFSAEGGKLVGKRRKLMPTAAERLIWGFGDGSTLDVHPLSSGLSSAVICWENYMPLLRMSQYAQGVELYCAPTVDDRPVWSSTMQTIALEGRCFVISANQYMERRHAPSDFEPIQGNEQHTILINGGSMIVGPLGDVMAGPVFGEETILTAILDLNELDRARMDFDVTGHYARPDIFHLEVNRKRQQVVTTIAVEPETE